MLQRLGRTGGLAAALAAVVLVASPAPARAPGSVRDAGSQAVLAACAGLPELPRARCGTVAVPLDRTDPALGTVEVAFALVPRRDEARPSLGTIVPNPGGPGVAAIGSPEAPYAELFAPLLDRRDLVLIDPRGTGRSGALACRSIADPGLVFGAPERFAAAIGACGRELGRAAHLYDTAAVADDIDAVRAALGVERLDLWGDSYGGFLMPVYAARHPEHVRSLVLDGAQPVNFDPWGRDRLAAARRAIRLVCARTRRCRGASVLAGIARLAARLRRDPIAITVVAGARRFRTRLDEAALARVVFAGGQAAVYGRIPAAVAAALDADLAPLRQLVEHDRLGAAAILREPSFSLAQNLATSCHDYPRAFSYADSAAARLAAYERALAALGARPFRPFSPAAWALTGQAGATCLEWPGDPATASPLPPGTALPDVPVLALSGDLDANAPSAGGRLAAAQFPDGRFAEIPNVGHTPAGSPCAVAMGLRFIATLSVAAGRCRGTGTPPPVAARAARRAAQLQPVAAAGATRAQRRALAVVLATVADIVAQAPILEAWGAARGLRGGRLVVAPRMAAIRLQGVRVVRDARVDGILALGRGDRLTGRLALRGRGVPAGRLRLRVRSGGRAHASGVLGGRPLDTVFRPEEDAAP
jgi:pimeloyl-ACP methyl ester carboxylesterase